MTSRFVLLMSLILPLVLFSTPTLCADQDLEEWEVVLDQGVVKGLADALEFGSPDKLSAVLDTKKVTQAELAHRDFMGQTPLMSALFVSSTGSAKCAQLLLDTGLIDINYETPLGSDANGYKTALLYAIESLQAILVELVLDAGADINGEGKRTNPLRHALGWITTYHGYRNQTKCKEIMKVLIRRGADIDQTREHLSRLCPEVRTSKLKLLDAMIAQVEQESTSLQASSDI